MKPTRNITIRGSYLSCISGYPKRLSLKKAVPQHIFQELYARKRETPCHANYYLPFGTKLLVMERNFPLTLIVLDNIF